MREIEFRGKRTDNGEWVYGNICNDFYKPKAGIKELWTFIQVINEIGYVYPFTVNPDTVGQFTGLKDKNGTKIFEGDVLKYEAAASDYADGASGVVTENYEVKYWAPDWIPFCDLGDYMDYYEVIGNIHETQSYWIVMNDHLPTSGKW